MNTKYCDSPIHKFSSLALAFIILAFCVLPSFVSADSVRPNEPIGYKDGDTFRDILLAVLDSWGISFSKSDSSDDTSILEYSDQLLEEFYEDNETTQELFWDLVKYGASQTGEIILDFLGVNKIRQFANWLKDKFSLIDNSSVPVSEPIPSSSLYYKLPYVGLANESLFYITVDNQSDWAYSDVYVSFYQLGNNRGVGFCFFTYALSPQNFLVNYDYGTYPTFSYSWSGRYTAYDSGFGYKYGSSDTYFYLSSSQVPSGAYVFPTLESAVESFHNFNPSPSPSISTLVINTTVINIPSDDDISPDDGIEISIPGTNWGDSIYTILDLFERLIVLYDNTQLEIVSIVETLESLISNLQTSVTVENIPGAVILDYDDYDIPLENEWGLFDIFFNTGGDDISLLRPWQELRSIIYGFPAPVLSFFALVVLFIVAYGFIRMGRDSH